ncbi:MAG TPA: NAD(P)H-hydrate dehydratase, partial [Longimicrobiales bacterium]|nr:NAD(P)H-hydrate dehydratase [Longimicrobiales bacterium]
SSTTDPPEGVFGRLNVPLPTAAQAAQADRTAHDDFGVPGRVLIESAGRAAALILQRLYPHGRIVGVAGSGHNGGDLLVMLRVLHTWGRDVALIAVGSSPPDSTLLHGVALEIIAGDNAGEALSHAAVIVDGILGTGAQGPPRGRIIDWIRRINDLPTPVLSLDLPTGVDATTGRAADNTVRADATVTFGWPKLGLLLHPAREHCGRLIAVEVGFPEACVRAQAQLITPDYVRAHLRPRAASAHKGTAGRLLVLAGHEGMAGAAAIASRAALRAGAGLLRIASSASNRVVLQTLSPEATFLDRARVTADELEPMHALVAGPGLGTDDEARSSLHFVLEQLRGKPTLLDADALNMHADEPGALRDIAAVTPLVITPHARELSRITGASVEEILADMPGAARAAARELDCVVLLKGQPSLVAMPDWTLLVNAVGSSDTATAGMGDQLAGTIGAFLAGGCETKLAAALGLFLSGRAADLADLGRSLSPDDVSRHLALAIADPGPTTSRLDLPFVTFDQPARH